MKTTFTFFNLFSICCLVGGLLFGSGATAQQSRKISLQGFLKDANGKAVPDGNQDMTFKLYTVDAGGTAEWVETQTIAVFGGIYSTQLGKKPNEVGGGVTNFGDLSWGTKTYYVGVNINGSELSPRTELTFAPYSLGTPTADVANTVKCSGAVGDIKYSILDPEKFKTVNGDCWVPMDGRNIVGSKLQTVGNILTLPDASGAFLRAQEFANGLDRDPNRTSASPIGVLQGDAMITHRHYYSGTTWTNGSHTHTVSDATFQGNASGFNAYNGGGGEGNKNETRTTSSAGDHAHNYSGDTADNYGTASTETRPKNLNFWVYIRIN